MTKTILAVVVALVVAGGAWFWYTGGLNKNRENPVTSDLLGTYAYLCDNGVRFDMTLRYSVSSVVLKAQGAAPFTEVVLEQKSGGTYSTEEGEVTLVGEGETINLTVGAANMTCNPVLSGDMAPFSWGNEREGSDPSPDNY